MKKLIEEFKAFAFKGNVVDMAVGVMIASAFGAIVSSVVEDLLTPLIGMIFGQPDFSGIKLGSIMVGNFINAVINFVIVAICIFAIVKAINKLKKPAPAAPEAPKSLCPFCMSEVNEKATRCPHCTAEMKPIKG